MQVRANLAFGVGGVEFAGPLDSSQGRIEVEWHIDADQFRLAIAVPDGSTATVQMPTGKATDEWTFGNLEEGFKNADLVLDETFMTQSTGHQPLETRTAMAYWQNGKLYLHGSKKRK